MVRGVPARPGADEVDAPPGEPPGGGLGGRRVAEDPAQVLGLTPHRLLHLGHRGADPLASGPSNRAASAGEPGSQSATKGPREATHHRTARPGGCRHGSRQRHGRRRRLGRSRRAARPCEPQLDAGLTCPGAAGDARPAARRARRAGDERHEPRRHRSRASRPPRRRSIRTRSSSRRRSRRSTARRPATSS